MKRTLGLTLIILTIQWSCKTEIDSLVDPTTRQAPITIHEAKDWYNQKAFKGARAANSSKNRMAYWDRAQATQLSNGTPVVIVPLFYNYRNPVIIPQDALGDKKNSEISKLSSNPGDFTITKKMIIAKDDQGGYKSCVMVIIPNKGNRKANSTIKMDSFEGAILIYSEDESEFLLSMEYSKGFLKNVHTPGSDKGARRSQTCYQAIYQNNGPNQVGGSSGNPLQDLANLLNIPMNFVDNNQNIYVLTDITEVDCSNSNPVGPPFSNPNNPNQAGWLFPGGSYSPGGGGPSEGPVPIDEGQPIDLGPTDLWLWDMRHRLGGPIYFNEEETQVIRDYPNLTYAIGNYVQQYGTKPDVYTFFSSDIRLNGLYGCIGTVAQSMNLDKLKSWLGRQVYGLYGVPGATSNITFQISTTLPTSTEGAFGAKGEPEGLSDSDLIKINDDLQSASKEYIAAIIIHELIHGLLNAFPGGITTYTDFNQRQHKSMFQSMVDPTADMLTELYPNLGDNNKRDAKALAIASLQAIFVQKFGQSVVDQTLNQYSIDHYGMSLGDALSIALSYRVKSKGTGC
jgi:hypothetical protein